uniref:Uncharacterized protein n=1 Tax=Avena sativa TaxID=4498 RepID=A0ACD5V6X9_AVESA
MPVTSMDSDEDTESNSSESEQYECKKVTIMRKKRKTDHSKKSRVRKRQHSNSSDETTRSSVKQACRTKKIKDNMKKKQKTSARKVENHRCCPHMIPPIIKRLSPRQKDWVRNIGWGVFLEMPECQLPKPITMWLVSKVNTKDKTLEIDGQHTIPIDKAIEQLIGLPNSKIRVPHPKILRTLPKAKKLDPDPSNAKFSDHGRGKKLPKIIEDLVGNDDEDDFCVSFVMVILAIYLAPGTSQTLKRGFLPHIQDVKKIKEMNWCDFAVQYLMKGINKFRSNVHTNINLQGCVHILLLAYISAIRSSKITVPPGYPIMKFVTTELLDLLAEEDQKDLDGSTHEPMNKIGRC